MSKKLIAKFNVKVKNEVFSDDSQVTSKETAEQEIKDLIDDFNKNLRNNEHERSYVNLIEIIEEEEEDYNMGDDDDSWGDDYDGWNDNEY